MSSETDALVALARDGLLHVEQLCVRLVAEVRRLEDANAVLTSNLKSAEEALWIARKAMKSNEVVLSERTPSPTSRPATLTCADCPTVFEAAPHGRPRAAALSGLSGQTE